ncbi:spore germination protein [Paenibacillus sp. S150]|nr:spore germination protein [Paenibacillus sp. S150]
MGFLASLFGDEEEPEEASSGAETDSGDGAGAGTREASGGERDGGDAAPAEADAAKAEDGGGKQDADAPDPDEPDGGGSSADGASAAGDGEEHQAGNSSGSGAGIGVDAGATGYGDHDLQPSDGPGTSGQEGTKHRDTVEAAEVSGDGGSVSGGNAQDTEAADELGAQEPESGRKGFFARLFGDDEEPEEDTGSDDNDGAAGEQAQAGPAGDARAQQPEKNGERAGKNNASRAEAKKDADPMQKKRDAEQSGSLESSIIYWQGNDKIPPMLEDTKKTLAEVMGLNSSFDVVFREMTFGGRKAALLCISGFAKDTIIDEILKRLTYLTPENISADVLASFMSEYIPHVQVEKGELLSESINKVLSGMSVIFLEGETEVIVMDTRSYPSRSPDEPSIERVVRGARDGFTETLLSNIALVRRRVRDPGLKLEMHQVGRRTRTDVCLAYIDDIVDKTQVQAVTDKIKGVDIDGIPLADKQLEEAIVGGGWNPYPLVRYSERPDVVASHLLEGRVVVFVDTSPSVMILPTTFFDLCQHAEENRQTPFMGTYLRWVRFIGIFASMFLLPLWMLLVIHPELKPAMLEFIGPQKTAKIPLLAQFLIVEIGVDLLRMAAVHTPTPLGSAMGLIAAILVGDIAVQTGLFVNEVVLYMAVASIGMFATPSYELGLANRIVRLALLLAVAVFQVPGFMIGSTLLVVLLTTHRSYNSSYLWPFIPFNAKAMGEILLRQPVLSSKTRPSFNKTRDNTRMPLVQEKEHKK